MEVPRKIQAAIVEYDELITLVKQRKLRWVDHILRYSGLPKTVLQGAVKRKEEVFDRRRRGKTIFESGQELTLPVQLGRRGGRVVRWCWVNFQRRGVLLD